MDAVHCSSLFRVCGSGWSEAVSLLTSAQEKRVKMDVVAWNAMMSATKANRLLLPPWTCCTGWGSVSGSSGSKPKLHLAVEPSPHRWTSFSHDFCIISIISLGALEKK